MKNSPSGVSQPGSFAAWIRERRSDFSIPPAINRLVRWQMVAKVHSAFRRAFVKRRLPLTIGALILGGLWLFQAVAGVLYRQSASPGQLYKWIPISLCCYFVWNALKTFGQKPIEPFNWNESEKEWLLASPLRRSQVIRYRGSAIIRAAFIKSLVFATIMSPDLHLAIYGFAGIFLGLIFIDISRLVLEIIAFGLSPRELNYCRTFVFGATAIVAGGAMVSTVMSLEQAVKSHGVATFGILMHMIGELVQWTDGWFGSLLLAPFRFATELILTPDFSVYSLARLALGCTFVLGLAVTVPWLDQFFNARRYRLEVQRFALAREKQEANQSRPEKLKAQVPFRLSGVGPIAWRQSFGVLSQFKPLCVSLLIPMVLSCLPIMTKVTGLELILQIVGSLAFYSALLMPSSMRFDFRRDIDRLGMLKSYPISAARICAGQIAVPVLILTGFQVSTLLLVQIMAPFNPLLMLAIIVAFLPFNVFLFSFENLLFLWYPYRLHSEGIQVLLRTILAFTAKSISMLVVLLATAAWLYVSRVGTQWFIDDPNCQVSRLVFAMGMFLLSGAMAGVAFYLLARAFRKFDPSTDLAGLK